MLRIRSAITAASFTLGTLPAVALAQVSPGPDPAPSCLEDVDYPGGACDKRPANPTGCPDSVSGPQNSCTFTQSASSGFARRTGYDRSCTYRPGVKINGVCDFGPYTTIQVRCHEATGTPCGGGGCNPC